MELYKKHRPKSLQSVIGQTAAVASLQKSIDAGNVPHTILLSGPSGCGKTTIARIMKGILDCGDGDFIELNCADFKGIDMVRDIRRHANLSPMHGTSRIWLIDEAHKLTGDAQAAFLKLLEDTPRACYFMLCTTDPQKLIKTIHTRATQVKLNAISRHDLEALITKVAKKENFELSEDIVREIAEAAEGSARKALVILDQVWALDSVEEQMAAIQTTAANKDLAIGLARELINPRASWPAVATILEELKDEPESIRYLVLGYCRSVLLGGGKLAPRAYKIVDIFSSNFYDSKHAGLAAACWEVIHYE